MKQHFAKSLRIIACVGLLGIVRYGAATETVNRQMMGVKTAYDWVRDTSDPSEDRDAEIGIDGDTCHVVHVNMVARHGYRVPASKDVANTRDLLEKITGRGNKVELEIGFPDDQAGLLNDYGRQEMRDLGSRTAIRFRRLLSGNQTRFEYISTTVPRIIDSAQQFALGLTGSQLDRGHVVVNNTLLRTFDACPRYEAQVKNSERLAGKLDDLKTSQRYNDVIKHVTDMLRLPNNVTLNAVDMQHIWEFCALDMLDDEQTKWCSLMTNTHREVMEEGDDMKTRFHLDAELASAMFQKFLDKRQEAAVYIWFLYHSYGNYIKRDINCVILTRLFQLMDEAKEGYLKGSDDYLVGSFMLGHSMSLQGAFTAVGLFRENEPWPRRQFRVNKVSHMAGNIGFGLYFCPDQPGETTSRGPNSTSGKFAVKLFFDERAKAMPDSQSPIAWYDDFKMKYKDALAKCDLEALCTIATSGFGKVDGGMMMAGILVIVAISYRSLLI